MRDRCGLAWGMVGLVLMLSGGSALAQAYEATATAHVSQSSSDAGTGNEHSDSESRAAGGPGHPQAQARAHVTGPIIGADTFVVPEGYVWPAVTAEGRADLAAGTLRAYALAELRRVGSEEDRGSAGATGAAGLRESFTVTTPAGSAGESFVVRLEGRVTGRQAANGGTAEATAWMNLWYEEFGSDPSPLFIRYASDPTGTRFVSRGGQRFLISGSTSFDWDVPMQREYAVEGGLEPMVYHFVADLSLRADAVTGNDAFSSGPEADMGATYAATLAYDPRLTVASAGGFPTQAIPEPAGGALLAAGGAGLLARRRRRARAG